MSNFLLLCENTNDDIINHIIEESSFKFATDIIDSNNDELIESLIYFVENIDTIDNEIADIFLENILEYVENESIIYSNMLFEIKEKDADSLHFNGPTTVKDALNNKAFNDDGVKDMPERFTDKLYSKGKRPFDKNYKEDKRYDMEQAYNDYNANQFAKNIARSPKSKIGKEIRDGVKRTNEMHDKRIKKELANASKTARQQKKDRNSGFELVKTYDKKSLLPHQDSQLVRDELKKTSKYGVANGKKLRAQDKSSDERFANNIKTGNEEQKANQEPKKSYLSTKLGQIKSGITKAFDRVNQKRKDAVNYFKKSDNPYSANKYESKFAQSKVGKKLVAAKTFVTNKFKKKV